MIGKTLRMNRIRNRLTGRSLVLPIDHGYTLGPIPGLESTRKLASWLPLADLDAVVLHKGLLTRLVEADLLGDFGVLLHINGMPSLAPEADTKTFLSSVRHAQDLGADGVSLQLNFTGLNDRENWQALGKVTDQAARSGMPVLLMLYDKVESDSAKAKIARQRLLLRAAMEMGVDQVKIGIPKDPLLLGPILADLSDDLSVIVAGGDLTDAKTFLRDVRTALTAGAKGVCAGRNVFGRTDPLTWSRILAQVVHGEGGLRTEVVHGHL